MTLELPVPPSAQKMGLKWKDYMKIAENVMIMSQLKSESWLRSILISADEDFNMFPDYMTGYADKLYDEVMDDENFFRAANLDFDKTPNRVVFGAGFYSAIANFYKKHPEKIPRE